MSYDAVISQIKAVPESCLEKISDYISYVMYQYEKEETEPTAQLAGAMLEALQISEDPNVKAYSDTKELFKDLNS